MKKNGLKLNKFRKTAIEKTVNKLIKKGSVIFLLMPFAQLSAAGLFAEIGYMGSNISIADQNFKPALLKASLGWQFTEQFSIELSQAVSQSEDSVSTVTAEIESLSSVMLRYGSLISNDVNVYVMLGYSEFDLNMQGNIVSSTETYGDTSWGLGFEERLGKGSGLRLHLDYVVHYAEQELRVDSVQLGLRYVFE